jgi:RNA-directed DNA polymerase
MTTDNRRTTEKPMAQAEQRERNLQTAVEGAMVVKAEREQSTLPESQHYEYTPKVETLVCDFNIQDATNAVKRNKGAPGIDNITVSEIDAVMQEEWPTVKKAILEGTYFPKPVKRVEIPKPDGKGKRKLGIPTVLDRIIQQAILQEIELAFEPFFSEYSYGFRPSRRAHQAVLQAQNYIQQGYNWVVDIDLEKFFDRVNHDMLMARVARRVKDKKILLLIRRYLESGVMENGLVNPSEEGTPQGGPLSPLLSNIMLDDFDKELTNREHKFCRYADDCNIYVKSEKAGKRVMDSAVKYLTEKLRLKVNLDKSAVDNPWNRKFLGFTFTRDGKPSRIKIHESKVKRFKDKVKGIIKKAKGQKVTEVIKRNLMPLVRGWTNYFGIAEIKSPFRDLDGWIRRKLRDVIWRLWKKPEKKFRQLRALGIKTEIATMTAHSNKGPWRIARSQAMHKALGNKILEEMGFIPMMKLLESRS